MCIVTRKTYVHPDNRREVVESHRLCHNAVGERLCGHIETRNEESVRVKERKPSSSRRTSTADIVTTSGGGREQHWKRLSKPTSKRNSSGRDSKTSTASPVDSAASSASPVPPVYQEFRPPSAHSPPLMSGALPSARHSGTLSPASPTRPPNPFRTVAPGGTAVYERPPSLEMPRADDNERSSLSRHPSISSTAAEVNEYETLPRRRSRKGRVTIDPVASGSKQRSSDNKGKSRARNDSLQDELELQRLRLLREENERQSQLERDRLAASNQRQSDRRSREQQRLDEAQAQIERDRLEAAETRRRSNLSREAEEAARRRAEDLQREREEASRERHRREAAAALEGQQQAQYDEQYRRMVEAERAAIDRERLAADARKRESAERYQEMRGSPSSFRSKYTYAPSSTTSARQYTVTTRPPNAIHQYPSARRESAIRERGERVIAREQARPIGATRRLTEAFGGMGLEDEEDLDGSIDDEVERVRRQLRKERERERRRQQGYFY